jgi:hypothetical protein
VDESATGSVNFLVLYRLPAEPVTAVDRIAPMMHLRMPALDHGVTSFLWALFFGLFIWIGGAAVGIAGGIAFIFGCVGAFLIFLFVRVYGVDEPRRP